MHPLSWFDNRTLLVCQCLLAAIFVCILFCIRRAYPTLRGTRSLTYAFLLGIPATLLLALRGNIPFLLSVVVANLMVYTCLLLVYCSLLEFFEDDRYFTFAFYFTGVIASLHIYFSLVHDRIVTRIIIVAVATSVFRLLMTWTILVHAHRLTHRLLFAATTFIFALVSISRIVLTFRHGAPQDYLQQNAVQTYILLLGFLYIASEGVFFLTLIYFHFTAMVDARARVDSLTGTLNRRGIEDRLVEELARSARAGTTVSILLIDLDHFKQINDTLGHPAGDDAIRHVSSSISSTLRTFDLLGRFGGDEFLLILPEVPATIAHSVAERLRNSLATLPSLPTLSIGIAQSDPGESIPSLLARADQALYQAKAAGRNCSRFQPSGAAPLTPSQSTLSR